MEDDEHIEGIDEVDTSEGQPLCPQCLEPFDPFQYYCRKCGGAVGQLTPYIPFVNIRFNYSIFGRMWRKVWYEKANFSTKLLCLVVMAACAPIIFVGVPFLIWERFRKRR